MKIFQTLTTTVMMMMGTLITVSSSSMFSSWLGLEMNTLGFIPMMINKNNPSSNESMMKYFMIQNISSSMFILTTISLNNMNLTPLYSSKFAMIIFLALMTKLGFPPLHFWMFPLVEFINWLPLMIFLTWQKLAPLSIILPFSSNFTIFMFIILSTIISPIMMINQHSLKKFLTYASMIHLSWMLTINMINSTLSFLYLLLHSISLLMIMITFNYFKINFISQILNNINNTYKLLIFLNILSMSGFPPLLGFFYKLFLIQMIYLYSPMITIILLLSSLLTSLPYIYLNISSFFSPSILPTKLPFKSSSLSISFFLMIIPTSTILMIPLLIL